MQSLAQSLRQGGSPILACQAAYRALQGVEAHLGLRMRLGFRIGLGERLRLGFSHTYQWVRKLLPPRPTALSTGTSRLVLLALLAGAQQQGKERGL